MVVVSPRSVPRQSPGHASLLRGDGSEVPVGRVAVPKGTHSTVHRPVRHRFGAGLSRGDGSGVLMGRVAVPKTSQKTA